MHNDSVFNYLLEQYFLTGSREDKWLWTRMGRNSWQQSLYHAGCNGEDTGNAAGNFRKSWLCEWGVGFFPFLLATATAFSQSVPGVVFLCEGVHLKLLLLPGDSFLAQTLKLVCIFFYLATQFRNIVCEKPRVTSEQQSRTQTLMCAWDIYSYIVRN